MIPLCVIQHIQKPAAHTRHTEASVCTVANDEHLWLAIRRSQFYIWYSLDDPLCWSLKTSAFSTFSYMLGQLVSSVIVWQWSHDCVAMIPLLYCNNPFDCVAMIPVVVWLSRSVLQWWLGCTCSLETIVPTRLLSLQASGAVHSSVPHISAEYRPAEQKHF